MNRPLASEVFTFLRRYLLTVEVVLLGMAVAAVELLGPYSRSDVDDIPWVLFYPLLFMAACSIGRYRELPITRALLGLCLRVAGWLRRRLILSLGLDFHPERHPRLPPFVWFQRASMGLGLAAVVFFSCRGMVREALSLCRMTGLYSVYVILQGALWVVLLAGLAVQVPASVLCAIEIFRSRLRLESVLRLAVGVAMLVVVGAVLVQLHRAVGIEGSLALLACGALLPTLVRPAEPPRAPWLAIAVGSNGKPGTTPLSRLVRDLHRMLALEAFVVVCALAPASYGSVGPQPVTDVLLAVYAWSAAWLYTGGALLAISEMNRRRRRNDPAFDRSRVIWGAPGPDTAALDMEGALIRRAGWRLVASARMPSVEDADLIVGLPQGLTGHGRVPVARIPPALFLLSDDPGAVLSVAEERDKAQRARVGLEQLLASVRPHAAGRGEGTFLVPHCWMVVGLTRDEERGLRDRPAALTFGQSYQAALGTRLRRFLFEVFTRAGVDVLYAEDAVTPPQVGEVLDHLFEHHIRRSEPAEVSEQDFMGVQGVRIVLHDVDPGAEGIPGVDTQLARGAVSRARILIVSRDRHDGGDDDGPSAEGESSDLWLQQALWRLFPRKQPV